jgi:hypothetical protein
MGPAQIWGRLGQACVLVVCYVAVLRIVLPIVLRRLDVARAVLAHDEAVRERGRQTRRTDDREHDPERT